MPNYSDRFVGIKAGTKLPGNDPQVVAEAIRRYGLPLEELLPFSKELKTIEEYYSFKGANEKVCNEKAEDWLVKYLFKHEWLPVVGEYISSDVMKNALKYSPLAVAVFAWAEKDGRYIRLGEDTHLTVVYGTYDNGDWKCLDSYPPFKKRLDKDFKFKWAKKIYISSPGVRGLERNLLVLLSQAIVLLTKRISELLSPKATPAVEPEEKPVTMPDEVLPPPVKESELPKLVRAIILVESANKDYPNGNDYARGDGGRAYGCMQIHQGTLLDVNAFSNTNYKLQDLLGNRKLSAWVFEQYMKLYAREKRIGRLVTDEDRARIWNGGPNGYKKLSTVKYWNAVKVALSQLT